MADTNFRGPIGAMGATEADSGGGVGTTTFGTASVQPFDGPSYFYQGVGFLDPRAYPFAKDGLLPGRAPAFLMAPNMVTIDAVPQAASTTALAAAQVVTALTPMALATIAASNFSAGAASIAVGVPLIPQGTTVVTTVIALDFGFGTGTTTANSSTVNVPDNTIYTAGQWIVVGNVANVAGTASLITQVQSVSANGTTLTVGPLLPATALGVPIGGANLWGSVLLPPATQFGPANASATAVSKTLQAGLLRIHNPREQLARNVVVAASASTGGTATILVTGYDVWGQLMTELLTASGTTVEGGKKGFKYILNAVPQTTQAASFTLGIGDTFSFPQRSDEVQQLQAWAGNTALSSSVGYIAAVTTPATNTTGDVRGTLQLSGFAGNGTPISSQATTNNVLRLYIEQTPSLNAIINTNPNNLIPMFGVTNSTT
jgi:hypothetical protein